MSKFMALITMSIDVEASAIELGIDDADKIALQNARCASDGWLDDIMEALLDIDDSVEWKVERA